MDIHRGKKVGVWLSVAAVLALLLTAAAVAVIVAACARIREINGGEEDDLSQY